MGLVRRAALEVARRIGVRDPDDVFETTADELRCLLTGAGPTPAELRARAERRELAAAADPPPMLVGDGEMPTPPTKLPPSVARIEALSAKLWASVESTEEPLHGLGVGTEVYRGPRVRDRRCRRARPRARRRHRRPSNALQPQHRVPNCWRRRHASRWTPRAHSGTGEGARAAGGRRSARPARQGQDRRHRRGRSCRRRDPNDPGVSVGRCQSVRAPRGDVTCSTE